MEEKISVPSISAKNMRAEFSRTKNVVASQAYLPSPALIRWSLNVLTIFFTFGTHSINNNSSRTSITGITKHQWVQMLPHFLDFLRIGRYNIPILQF